MKITINVKLNSKKPSIEVIQAVDPIILKIKTNKIPENGAANKDVIQQLSVFFHCPSSHIKIISGLTYSRKIVDIPLEEEYITKVLKQKEHFLL